jgi:hypothetical protein
MGWREYYGRMDEWHGLSCDKSLNFKNIQLSSVVNHPFKTTDFILERNEGSSYNDTLLSLRK